VPATQVAEWAGHSVHLLMRVYAKCVYGQDEAARRRIEAALNADDTPAKKIHKRTSATRMRRDRSAGAGLDGFE
jgi:hypothetical protein